MRLSVCCAQEGLSHRRLIMQTRSIMGPFDLTEKAIAQVVTQTSAGNYALGAMGERAFRVFYVNRSDDDVAKELSSCVKQNPRYKAFKFSYAPDPKTAFDRECDDYHDFGKSGTLDNADHPERPDASDWLCPQCDVYG